MTTPLSPSAMLALSMHAQPGVYALLLGSGVSTGSGMPTGWGVVTDLVRKIAAQEDPDSTAEAENDPHTWWQVHHGERLGYSSLLETLAPTAAARQGLLVKYFEPTEEEHLEGIKSPSKAHDAIAKLVKKGYVRVVLTTNFDRLIEQALEAEGVAAQVISRPDAVGGMQPLAHAEATLIKLHGDYKDLGSLNTPDELAAYPAPWNELIAQVLNEFGLVISGWSADWDKGLVTLMEAIPSRRYPLYWDSRSSKGDSAKRLLTLRSGKVIAAGSSDELFTEVLSNIESLEGLAEAPLTTAMAVSRLKRYLPNPVHRIDLYDLVMGAADRVTKQVDQQPLSAATGADGAWAEGLYQDHLQATTPLLHLLTAGVWHDEDRSHERLWLDVVQRLVDAGTRKISQCGQGLDDARLYPALLATTAMGLVSVHRDRESLMLALAESPKGRGRMGHGDPEPAGVLLHPQSVIQSSWVNAMPRFGGQPWIAPQSHLLRADVRSILSDYVPSDDDYAQLFSRYEYRLALIHSKHNSYPLLGEYVGDRSFGRYSGSSPSLEMDFKAAGDAREGWPWFSYFGSSDALETAVAAVAAAMEKYERLGFW